jgi:hypothetical protein
MLLCALTLANTAHAGFIPYERSRTVVSSAAILNDAPAQIKSFTLDTFDRLAFEKGIATNSSKDALATSAAMLVSNGFDGSGIIKARGTSIAEATMVEDEYGFAAAITTFSVLFRVTDTPLTVVLNWSIWIGLDQLIQVEHAEVLLESLSKEKPVAGGSLQHAKATDSGSFTGELEPGTYRLTAKALSVANTDLLKQEHIKSQAGFDFALAVVPTPAASPLFAIGALSVFRRQRR